MYRKNFFGLFGSSEPKYYVYEALVDAHDPNMYGDDEEDRYLRNINSLKASNLSQAIQRAQQLIDARKRTRRGANMIFIVEKNGSEISFVDYNPQTDGVNLLSFSDFKREWNRDLDINMRLNPQSGYPHFDWIDGRSNKVLAKYAQQQCYQYMNKTLLPLARTHYIVGRDITATDPLYNQTRTIKFLGEAEVLEKLTDDLIGKRLLAEADFEARSDNLKPIKKATRKNKMLFNMSAHPIGYNLWRFSSTRREKTMLVPMSRGLIRFGRTNGPLLIFFYKIYNNEGLRGYDRITVGLDRIKSLCSIYAYGQLPHIDKFFDYQVTEFGETYYPNADKFLFMSNKLRDWLYHNYQRKYLDRILTANTWKAFAKDCFKSLPECT